MDEARGSEFKRPGIAELIDVPTLQSMMDDFFVLSSLPMALLDTEGVVIVKAGWQEVCTRFHRVNAITCAHCIESDTVLTANIPAGSSRLYRCKNGMWDAAMPVVVGGSKVGNVFTGQFFFDDEEVDLDFFRNQARVHDFPADEYLDSIARVPRLPRDLVEAGLRFLSKLAHTLSDMSVTNAELAELVHEHKVLLAREQEQSARLGVLAEVDEILATSLDLAEVIAGALDSAERHLGVVASSVWVFAEEMTRLVLVGRRGFPEVFASEFASVSRADPFPVARAADRGEPVIYRRVRDSDLHRPVADAYARYGIELDSLAAVPLIARGEVIGGLTLAWTGERPFDADELWLINTLSGRFSAAIENARLFEDRSAQAEYAEALNRVNSTIHSVLETAEIMRVVVAEMAVALGTEVSLIQLRGDGGWEIPYRYGIPEETRFDSLSYAEAPLSVLVATTRRPIVVHDVMADERARHSVMRRLGVRSLLGVPLFVRGEVIGVLFAAHMRQGREFTNLQVDFAGKVAAAVSLALENARLYQSAHLIAETLQGALLALPKQILGVEFASAYHSAADAARVGGDFFDLFDIGDNRIGITIGDVAGKGLDAAVLTSLAKNTIRAHASEPGKRPGRILSLTNDVVYRATDSESFVTIFFGLLDAKTGDLVWANAGHTTTAVISADGKVNRLAATGPLLGAFAGAAYEEGKVRLDAGDLMLLYTDGVTEARHDGELYGERRLFSLLAKSGGVSPQRLVRAVTEEAVAFSNYELRDDLALLALRRIAEEEHT